MKHHLQRGGPFKPPKKRRRRNVPIPDELRIGSLCTGYGGLDMAVRKVFGGAIAWVADNDRHVSKLLARRFPVQSNGTRSVPATMVHPGAARAETQPPLGESW